MEGAAARAELLLLETWDGTGGLGLYVGSETARRATGEEEESLPSSRAVQTSPDLMQSAGCSGSSSLVSMIFPRGDS